MTVLHVDDTDVEISRRLLSSPSDATIVLSPASRSSILSNDNDVTEISSETSYSVANPGSFANFRFVGESKPDLKKHIQTDGPTEAQTSDKPMKTAFGSLRVIKIGKALKWESTIAVAGSNVSIGRFSDTVLAKKSHDRACITFFGPDHLAQGLFYPARQYLLEPPYVSLLSKDGKCGFKNRQLTRRIINGEAIDASDLKRHIFATSLYIQQWNNACSRPTPNVSQPVPPSPASCPRLSPIKIASPSIKLGPPSSNILRTISPVPQHFPSPLPRILDPSPNPSMPSVPVPSTSRSASAASSVISYESQQPQSAPESHPTVVNRGQSWLDAVITTMEELAGRTGKTAFDVEAISSYVLENWDRLRGPVNRPKTWKQMVNETLSRNREYFIRKGPGHSVASDVFSIKADRPAIPPPSRKSSKRASEADVLVKDTESLVEDSEVQLKRNRLQTHTGLPSAEEPPTVEQWSRKRLRKARPQIRGLPTSEEELSVDGELGWNGHQIESESEEQHHRTHVEGKEQRLAGMVDQAARLWEKSRRAAQYGSNDLLMELAQIALSMTDGDDLMSIANRV